MKKVLNFGIDIDGTVTCPKTFVPYLNKSFNKNLTYNDIKQYNLAQVINITEDEFNKWLWENEEEIYKDSLLSEAVKETLYDWHNKHQLIYISARHKRYEQLTYDWFSKHNIPYHDIHCTGAHNKITPVRSNKIDLFFEDNYNNACQIAEECEIPVVLFDTPYNQGVLPKDVKRVPNWNEANTWVNNWIKQNI
jgi:uncharacterized protein